MTTPAELRAVAEEALREPGKRHKRARARLDVERETLRPLVLRAVAVEVPYRRIEEITGITRVTITAWKRRGEDEQ